MKIVTPRLPVRRPAASLQWPGGLSFTLLAEGVRAAAGYHTGTLVLDVGCGSKPFAPHLMRQGDSWIGMDLPVTAAGASRADVFGSAMAAPFATGVFDTVLCTQVLEHVPQPWLAMVELSRMLRPGGHLIATVPHISVLHEEPHDYFRYTPYGLHQLACLAGLEPVRVQPLGGFAATIGYLLIARASVLLRLPALGHPLTRWTNAVIGWLALQLDTAEIACSPCPPKHALNYLLIARKP
jgi:SAM-dependent methyltransferase